MELLSILCIFFGGLFLGGLISRFFPPHKKGDFVSSSRLKKVQLTAVLGEIYDQYTQTISRHRLLITIGSLLDEPLELYQWYVLLRSEGRAGDRKIIYRPQNLTSTLPARQQFTIEVTDLSLFDETELVAIVVRSNHGEFRLEGDELLLLNQELDQIIVD
jgi:hypothetical protein